MTAKDTEILNKAYDKLFTPLPPALGGSTNPEEENKVEKEKEAMSLKKAVMSVQGDFKDERIGVEFITKKGNKIETSVKIPMGRKIRQSIMVEKRRAIAKAKLEASRRSA